MALATKSFDTLVQDQATAVQASADVPLDLSIGTTLRALVEANATLGLWEQAMILQVLTRTRAATSNATDLDTWVADFGLTRTAGVPASGLVTFARFVVGQQALVPIGATLETVDGAGTFAVIVDTANAAYSATLGGYIILAAAASVTVPVRATVAGAGAFNVAAGALNTLTTSIIAVDTVTNASPFVNGADPETDPALRVRFIAFLASLSRTTLGAIAFAVSSVEGVETYGIVENQQPSGAQDYGFFYVVVDDGSGTPPSTLLDSVSNAVNLYRAVSIRFTVIAPTVQTVAVSAQYHVAAGYLGTDVKLAVDTALGSFIAALPLGGALYYTKLAQVMHEASPGLAYISNLLVAGGTADIVPSTARTVLRPGTISTSVA